MTIDDALHDAVQGLVQVYGPLMAEYAGVMGSGISNRSVTSLERDMTRARKLLRTIETKTPELWPYVWVDLATRIEILRLEIDDVTMRTELRKESNGRIYEGGPLGIYD